MRKPHVIGDQCGKTLSVLMLTRKMGAVLANAHVGEVLITMRGGEPEVLVRNAET